TFVVFNLFVGVIVNAMEETNRADLKLIREADETQEHVARLSKEIRELKAMIAELKESRRQ
ncbi:MAG: ion transporter, partial [Bacillota bacterium]